MAKCNKYSILLSLFMSLAICIKSRCYSHFVRLFCFRPMMTKSYTLSTSFLLFSVCVCVPLPPPRLFHFIQASVYAIFMSSVLFNVASKLAMIISLLIQIFLSFPFFFFSFTFSQNVHYIFQ